MACISVFLADDNLLVRAGVRALLDHEPDLEVVGEAADHDGLLAGAESCSPQVVVTDIRMPPTFQREGLEAAKELRRRLPGIGVVVLSQFDDPEYAVSLLADGAAGYGYLLKDRVAEGTQLADAIRAVATGRTALDPTIVDALTRPVERDTLPGADEELLKLVASGRTIKAIAAARRSTPEAAANDVERLFLTLAKGASAGEEKALQRLRDLHQVIVDQVETGETLSRLLPTGLAQKLRANGRAIGESERVVITVVMSDIRGYSTISEAADPAGLATQLSEHRAVMNEAVVAEGGTVMLYVGDAVMATFGDPLPQVDHAQRGLETARRMHSLQQGVNERWERSGLAPFHLGIGLSTGEAAAALLGSEERLEYTVIGDTVNLAQRLQQLADPGETVLSEATWTALAEPPVEAVPLGAQMVKGRNAPVVAYKVLDWR
jgi:class 3 adenylate cyclase/FixJ family two-component response regulator